MEPPDKAIPDSAFAAHVIAERDRLQDSDALNAAERAGVRELLGLLADVRQMVADERFQKEASARIGKWRDSGKNWLLAIAAVAGVITAIATAIKSF